MIPIKDIVVGKQLIDMHEVGRLIDADTWHVDLIEGLQLQARITLRFSLQHELEDAIGDVVHNKVLTVVEVQHDADGRKTVKAVCSYDNDSAAVCLFVPSDPSRPITSYSERKAAIAKIITDRGEEILNDDGVDQTVTDELAAEILRYTDRLESRSTDGRFAVRFYVARQNAPITVGRYDLMSEAIRVGEFKVRQALADKDLRGQGVSVTDMQADGIMWLMHAGEVVKRYTWEN